VLNQRSARAHWQRGPFANL